MGQAPNNSKQADSYNGSVHSSAEPSMSWPVGITVKESSVESLTSTSRREVELNGVKTLWHNKQDSRRGDAAF